MTLKLFIYKPQVVMEARVNQSSFTYPIDEVTVDNVDGPNGSSSWDDVRSEMTVIFGQSDFGEDDLGRQRVRISMTSSTTLEIGRSSQGARDGEVDLQDNAYITVFNDFRAWAQIPYIDTGTDPPTIYKDSELAAGNNVTVPPPIANCGAPMAGTVDSGGNLRVTLPHESQTSFITNPGSTLTSYTWELPPTATLVSTEGPSGESVYDGNKVDAERITVDQTAGLAYYRLLVTDNNGKSHAAWVPVYAYEAGGNHADMLIEEFQIVSREHTPQGQSISFRILEDIPETSFPDGTLVMLWDGEPADGEDRSHMEFWGWHQSDPARILSERTGIVKDITFECVDIGGRLGLLPGFPFMVGVDSNNFSGWSLMPGGDWLRFMHYLLNWHSNAYIVADWKPSSDLDTYDFYVRSTTSTSLYQQAQANAQAMVPDYHFSCNRLGQLLTVVDPQLQDLMDRNLTTQATVDEDDWNRIEYENQFWPRYHWLREEALKADNNQLVAYHSIAPGESPGMGEGSRPRGEQLAKSQADLNSCCGHRYARLNSGLSLLRVTLPDGDDRGIDPAVMEYIDLQVPSSYAAQRGFNLPANSYFLPQRVDWRYSYAPTGVSVEVQLTLEFVTIGNAGVTYTPPDPS